MQCVVQMRRGAINYTTTTTTTLVRLYLTVTNYICARREFHLLYTRSQKELNWIFFLFFYSLEFCAKFEVCGMRSLLPATKKQIKIILI